MLRIGAYHRFASNRSKSETVEMSPMCPAAVQTIPDPYRQQKATKISPHVQQVNH